MPDIHIDANTFQKPLAELAEVLSQKVKRETPKLLAAPGFVSFDLHVLIRAGGPDLRAESFCLSLTLISTNWGCATSHAF
jgi:hypothetical protein